MRVFRTLLAAGLLLGMGMSAAQAQSVYVGSDDEKSSLISGEIVEVNSDYVDIMVNDEIVRVETDDVNLDNAPADLLKVGNHIKATGKFDDDHFEAEGLVLMDGEHDANIIIDE